VSAEVCAACERPEPQDIDAPLCRIHFNRYIAIAMTSDDPMPYPACHILEDAK
jgi:hypothetical protein